MRRLNSGITNMDNFYEKSIFGYPKFAYESIDNADSGDTKIFVWFAGSSVLEIWFEFWKCVGFVDMRGRFLININW